MYGIYLHISTLKDQKTHSIVKDDLCRIFTICIIRFENGFAAAGAADLERDKGE